MSATRRALWLAQVLRPDVSHVVAFAVTITGPLDAERLTVSADAVLDHVGWRDVHIPVDLSPADVGAGEPLRRSTTGRESVTVVDLQPPVGDPMTASTRRTVEFVDAADGADLTEPLWRSELHVLSPELHRWVIRVHHVLTDGAGALRVVSHIADVYAGTADPVGLELPADEDLEAAETAYAASERYRDDARYWGDVLDRHEPALLAGSMPSEPTSRLTRVTHRISSSRPPSTDETVAAFAGFCARLLDRADIGLGLPVAARTSALRRRAVQPLSTVVPLTLDGIGDRTAAEAVADVRTAIVGALRHQLHRREDMVRGRDDTVDFGPMVNLLPDVTIPDVPGLGWDVEVLRTGPVTDVSMTVHPADEHGDRGISWEAPATRFDTAALNDLARRFDRFLSATLVEIDDGRPVPAESIFLPGEWTSFRSRSGSPAPPFVPTSALLDEYAQYDPAGPGLVSGGLALSRSDLLDQVDRWAQTLIDAGVRPGDAVAVSLERSAASVVAFWSVIRAGAVWLPMDPTLPVARKRKILGRLDVAVGLSAPGHHEVGPTRWIEIDIAAAGPNDGVEQYRRPPGLDRGPDDRAYVLFTSGSTGEPKGVDMPHRGLPALVAEIRKSYALSPDSRMLHVSSPTFDSGLVDMLSAVATGATLVVAPAGVDAGAPLARLIDEAKVTHLIVTPSVLDTLPRELCDQLQQVVLGGERVPPSIVDAWGARVPLRNAYGPTETRCSVNFSGPMLPGCPVTVGPPMVGVTEAILDRSGRPQPPGAIGVLHVSGPQVADGYLGAPELTAEVFLDSSISADPVMYRTGDLATWTADGEVRVLGRRDGQVKMRGLRIELGEVDTALARIAGVARSATIMRELPSGRSELVSFVVSECGAPAGPRELRRELALTLPPYMIPARVVVCDQLPRTATGKLDSAALCALAVADRRHGRVPDGWREVLLLHIVGEVLGLTTVDPDASFLEQGGDSLAVIRIVQRLVEAGHREIGPDDLLRATDLASVAAQLTNPPVAAPLSPPDGPDEHRTTADRETPLTPAQRTVSRARDDPDAQIIRVGWLVPVGAGPPAEHMEQIIGVLLDRHPALRSSFPDTVEGPVRRVAPHVPTGLVVDRVTASTYPTRDDLEAVADGMAERLDVRSGLPLAVTLVIDALGSISGVVAVAHHIAVDGHSLALLASEMDRLLCGADLPPLPGADVCMPTPCAGGNSDDGFQLEHLASLPDSAWTLGGVRVEGIRDRAVIRQTARVSAAGFGEFRSHAAARGITAVEAFRAEIAETLAEVTGDRRVLSATPVSRRPPGGENLVGDFVLCAIIPIEAGADPTVSADIARRWIDAATTPMEDILFLAGRPVSGSDVFPVPVLIGWSPEIDGGSALGEMIAFRPDRGRWVLQIEGSPMVDGRLGIEVTGLEAGLGPDTVHQIARAIHRRIEGRWQSCQSP